MPTDEPAERDADDFAGSADDDPTSDDDLPYVALFAGVPAEDVEDHAAQLRSVLGPTDAAVPEPAAPAKPKRKAPQR